MFTNSLNQTHQLQFNRVKPACALCLYIFILFSAPAFSQDVKIGTQIWSAKNLDVAFFRNGDSIPYVANYKAWKEAGIAGKPAWCYVKNDPANGMYGKLYNWYAVNDPRGLAPDGWHVATYADFMILNAYAGGQEIAGRKLKSVDGWKIKKGKDPGTDDFGFKALPAGIRYYHGAFNGIDAFSYWWTANDKDYNYAIFCSLVFHSNIGLQTVVAEYKAVGMSVRCVKN